MYFYVFIGEDGMVNLFFIVIFIFDCDWFYVLLEYYKEDLEVVVYFYDELDWVECCFLKEMFDDVVSLYCWVYFKN